MKLKIKNIFLSLMTLTFCVSTQAKTFENDYLKMLIPDSWTCNIQQNSWICHQPTSKKQIEALYILNAKIPGPQDTFTHYHKDFGRTKEVRDARGNLVRSNLIYKKDVLINDVKWLLVFQENSEVFGFKTHYVATLDKGLSVLVSLSVTDEAYDKYKDIFNKSIESLVVKKVEPLTANQESQLKKINPHLSPDFVVGKLKQKKKFVDLKNPKFIALIMGVLALILIIFAFKK